MFCCLCHLFFVLYAIDKVKLLKTNVINKNTSATLGAADHMYDRQVASLV